MRRGICFFMAVALCIWAVALCRRAESLGSGVTVLLDRAVTLAEAEEIWQREGEEKTPVGFCLYGPRQTGNLSCPDTGKTALAPITAVYGNTALLGAEALTWSRGCVPDRQTAQNLFGTERLGAQQVRLAGETLPALAVHEALTPGVLASAGAEDTLTRCVLAGWDENGAQTAQAFLLRHGLSGTVLNYFPLLAWAKNAALLPLWGLLALASLRAGERKRIFGVLLALAGGALLFRFLVIPRDAIPSPVVGFFLLGEPPSGAAGEFPSHCDGGGGSGIANGAEYDTIRHMCPGRPFGGCPGRKEGAPCGFCSLRMTRASACRWTFSCGRTDSGWISAGTERRASSTPGSRPMI